MAFVVRAPHAAGLTAEAVQAYVAARVAPHKKIRHVAFLDAIPKTASGKILRRDLAATEAAAS
jgi:acyl-coenzyme A synthetase/AMP-(fatty) acid ligase